MCSRVGLSIRREDYEGKMKIIAKAKHIKSGETVIDRGTRFIIKEIRVRADSGEIEFIDTDDVRHGRYHPDEYLGVEEEFGHRYVMIHDWQFIDCDALLANMPWGTVH